MNKQAWDKSGVMKAINMFYQKDIKTDQQHVFEPNMFYVANE